jgi:hypothetical protein
VLKLINRNLLAFRLRLHRFAELLRHLPQHYRGMESACPIAPA